MYNNRIKVEDQWASHPSTQDREGALLKYGIQPVSNDEPAWSVFSDPLKLQKMATDDIYSQISFEQEPVLLSEHAFTDKFTHQFTENSLQPEYHAYYDNRNIERFDLEPINLPVLKHPLTDLFDTEYINLVKTVGNLDADISQLNSLITGAIESKSFDFDGDRYTISQAAEVKDLLEKEQMEMKAKIQEHDLLIYQIALGLEKGQAEELRLKEAYSRIFDFQDKTLKWIVFYHEMYDVVALLYTTMKQEEIQHQVMKVINKDKEFKLLLEALLADESMGKYILKEQKEVLDKFMASKHIYFNNQYENAELDLLQQAQAVFIEIILDQNFNIKKEALAIQLKLLKQVA